MAINATTIKPVEGISTTAARLSFAGATAFMLLLAALHVLKPELDPSWHFISEYAIGSYGWMMDIAFYGLALSFVSLFIAIRSQASTIAGRIGLVLLLVSAAGLILAALFTTDPIATAPDAHTAEGNLHNLGGTLGIAMPFAALLTSLSLVRNPAWISARRSIMRAAGLALAGFLVGFLSLGVMLSQSGGTYGPDVLVGWPNRFEMLAYCVWLLVVARHASRLAK